MNAVGKARGPTIDSPPRRTVQLAVHRSETPSSSSSTTQGAAPRVVAAIPARLASTRLPEKPLVEICGRPMIEHVYRRVAAAEGLARVVVLTDDQRIAETVRGFGGECEMTPVDCASGTDRIARAARGWDGVEAIVNVQGDEPLIEPATVTRLARHLVDHPGDPIATLAAPADDEAVADPDVVKVVTDARGYALYFSRAAIPFRRRPAYHPLHHVGIYGYQRAALLELASLPPSPLEETESLEQLRALENGLAIRVLEISTAPRSVDTADDLKAVERLIRMEGTALTAEPERQPI